MNSIVHAVDNESLSRTVRQQVAALARYSVMERVACETYNEEATRSNTEMMALITKIDDMVGPVDKWSPDALDALLRWMGDRRLKIGDVKARRA